MTFANPEYLFLLLLLLPIVGWYIYELRKSDASVQVSDTRVLAAQPKSIRIWLLHVPFVLRIAVITLISIALARPQLRGYRHHDGPRYLGYDVSRGLAPEPFGGRQESGFRLRYRPSE